MGELQDLKKELDTRANDPEVERLQRVAQERIRDAREATELESLRENVQMVMFMVGAQDARSMDDRGIEIPARTHLFAGYPVFQSAYTRGFRSIASEREERTG